MSIRAVIFDFGGVIVRTEDQSNRRKWERRLGLPEGSLPAAVLDSDVSFRAQRGEITEREYWLQTMAALGLRPDQSEEFRLDFWSGDRLDAELVQFLRDLRLRCKTAILSNAFSNAREAFTNHFKLADAVDLMVISAEEGVMKPDARIYQIAAERLGVHPEEAVFVDDMEANVRGALAAGMHGVPFRDTQQVKNEVDRLLNSKM